MKTIRFILNIIRVSMYYLLTGRLKEFCFRAWDGIPQIWAALSIKEGESVDDKEFAKRMKECASCPVFDEVLKTCGNPWDRRKDWDDPDEGQIPTGCFCQMEFKAKLKDASCWLNEETNYAYGWKRGD